VRVPAGEFPERGLPHSYNNLCFHLCVHLCPISDRSSALLGIRETGSRMEINGGAGPVGREWPCARPPAAAPPSLAERPRRSPATGDTLLCVL
jgi:hypothetical protein